MHIGEAVAIQFFFSFFLFLLVIIVSFVRRLEEKISDMESENQVLRQQTLLKSPVKKILEHPPIPVIPVKFSVNLLIFLSHLSLC